MMQVTPTKVRRLVVFVSFLLLIAPIALDAQLRQEFVANGIARYYAMEHDAARDYFVRALDPLLAEPDSLWAVGLQFLTQMHIEASNGQMAGVWMRWAVRHFPGFFVDSIEFRPEVIATYYTSLGIVGSGTPGDSITETKWEWPSLGDREMNGSLRAGPSTLPVPLSVNILGGGTIAPGEDMTLTPGTYSIRASAEGYNEVTVSREVLPGVTSVLTFDLQPTVVVEAATRRPGVLPEDAEAAMVRRLARFSVTRYHAEPTCGTGFLAGGDGLLLTTYTAIRGAEALEVELADGSNIKEDITVAAWDTDRNLAVLKLPISSADSISLSTNVSDSQFVWGFAHPGCGDASVEQLRVASWENRPAGLIRLIDSYESGDQGGPLVAQSGVVLALASGNRTAVPADHVSRYLETARQNVSSDRLVALQTVAERENHLYGSVMIQSTFENATASVRGLENWHWPETETSDSVPLTYTGPMGRYRLNLQAMGQQAHQAEFTIDPGVFKEVTEPQVIAAEPGGRGFPWPIALLGAAGAAVAGVLVLGSGGDDTNGNGNDGPGTISVVLP